MRYTVVLEREADGGYVATVPALPGCVSQGDTRDEVTRNIREAADLYIEDCIATGDPVPTEAGREYFELTGEAADGPFRSGTGKSASARWIRSEPPKR